MATVKAAHYPCSTAPAPLVLRAVVAGMLMAAVVTGCGKPQTVRSSPPHSPPPREPSRDWSGSRPTDPAAANAVLMRAIGLVGTPYRYGGNTPDSGFDCSGLVNYVFRDMLDLRLPRTSRELAAMQGPKIATNRLAPADLVFFGAGGEVSHVGIYVGEGRFVHAPRTGGTVRLDHLDGAYWRNHYTGAKRVLQ
jgi:cell wall-associated NlpC family hydrolase